MSDVGRYRKVYPRIWRHPGFMGLKPSTRELTLYLLSGPQTNAIGLFHFSPATAAEDLKVSIETVRKGLTDVATTFDWRFDADARVIYIPSWWRFNQPENPNVLISNLKALSEIPPCGLVDSFARNVETLRETLRETFVVGCRVRLPKRPSNQDQDQEHLSGAFQEHEQRTCEKNAKDGGDDALLPVARDALKLVDRGAPLETIVDTFYQMPRTKGCSRSQAVRLLNIAIQESRAS